MKGTPFADPHLRCAHRRYKMTCEEYDALVVVQGGKCALCGGRVPCSRSDLTIDHDHALGPWAVRGLLCHYCNTGPLRLSDAGGGETPRVARYKANAWHMTNRSRDDVEEWAEERDKRLGRR